MFRHASLALSLLVALVGSGCSNHPEVVPVSGTVLFQGEPVDGAHVSFQLPGAPRHAAGTTDAAGRFTLTTFKPGDGALPGEHEIVVYKWESATAASDSPGSRQAPGGGKMANYVHPKSMLPARYENPKLSDLRVTVESGSPMDLVIELTE
jgi:hypothetical protein